MTIIRNDEDRFVAITANSQNGARLDVRNAVTKESSRAVLTAYEAHKLAEWIIENVEKPKELPTEPGLYQITSPGRFDEVEHALTYRHIFGYWANALNNEGISELALEGLKKAYREGRLAKLTREVVKP